MSLLKLINSPENQPVNHIPCDFSDLEHVHTTPQEQMTLAYVQILEEQLRHTKSLMLRAQVYLAIGETGKAHAALSQGVSS